LELDAPGQLLCPLQKLRNAESPEGTANGRINSNWNRPKLKSIESSRKKILYVFGLKKTS
jgi:hypothetical protein